MSPTQQGRFCNSCARQVVDFSSMSDKEVLNYFSSIRGKEVCGRAFPQQLERTIEINADKPKRFYQHYLNYAALLLLLFKAGHVKAQGKVAVKPLPNMLVKHKLAKNNSPFIKTGAVPNITMGLMITQPPRRPVDKPQNPVFTGYVADESGLPMPAASVFIKATGEAITADSTGRFVLKNFKAENTITVSAVGYNDTSVAIKESGQTISLTKKEILLKDVVITSYGSVKGRMVMTGAVSSISSCHRVKDSIVKRIMNFSPSVSIYPNPVMKGNMLHVSVNFKKEGQYNLQVLDAGGRQLFQQSIQATAKNYLKEIIAEQSWGSGMFIIRIVDSKNSVVKTGRYVAL